jgi:hypothetical protein
MSDTEVQESKWAALVVDEIPPSKRASREGMERDTDLKQLYRWITAQPVGTKVRYKEGAHSPSYGGDKAKERFPLVKFTARQTGEVTYTGRGGVEKTGPAFDLYVTHVGANGQEGEANPPGQGLLD